MNPRYRVATIIAFWIKLDFGDCLLMRQFLKASRIFCLGFGSFKLRVRVAHYSTADNRDQVLAFYRKALSEYGNVIECVGGKPVGTVSATREGLTCDHSDHDHSTSHSPDDLQLKAGSTRHQHIVAFGDGSSSATHFTLIALDLPHGFDNEEKGTN